MNDDQIAQLFKKIEDLSENVATKDDIAQLRDDMHTGFDQMASRVTDDDVERVALMSQVDRHEGWIKKIADKTSTDLVVEA